MGKNKKKHRSNEDGFYKLVPREELANIGGTQAFMVKDLLSSKKPKYDWVSLTNAEGETDPEKRIDALTAIIRAQQAVIDTLEKTLDVSTDLMEEIYGNLGLSYGDNGDVELIKRSRKPFFRATVDGVEVTRTNLASLVPDFIRRIDGIVVDYKPGKGLSVTPHLRSDEGKDKN